MDTAKYITKNAPFSLTPPTENTLGYSLPVEKPWQQPERNTPKLMAVSSVHLNVIQDNG
jgi:hypothetical protein